MRHAAGRSRPQPGRLPWQVQEHHEITTRETPCFASPPRWPRPRAVRRRRHAPALAADAAATPGDATAATRQANEAVLQQLPFNDRRDYEDAQRGWLGTLADSEIRNAQGRWCGT